MLSYEQLKPALFKWATYYVSNKHDLWELVSVAWLSSSVQKLENIKYASKTVKFAMLHYIREYSHKRRKTQLIIHRFSRNLERSLGKINNQLNKIDSEDRVNWIIHLACLNSEQKYAFQRQYIMADSQKEIAQILKCTPQNIAYLIRKGLKKLKLCIKYGN